MTSENMFINNTNFPETKHKLVLAERWALQYQKHPAIIRHNADYTNRDVNTP